MQRGTRKLGERFYILFNALPWQRWNDEHEEHLQSEAAAARKRYECVRVIKDNRRGRAFIYVFGER